MSSETATARLVKREGLLVRDDPNYRDYAVLADLAAYHALQVHAKDRVLDLGAHVGGFTKLIAAPSHPASIVAVEPDPGNFAVLRENCRDLANVTLVNAAVGPQAGKMQLWRSRRGSMSFSLYEKRGQQPVTVEVKTLTELCEQAQPTVVKVDIEGAEYEIGLGSLPESVRALIVELHFSGRDWFLEAAKKLVAELEAIGLRPEKPIKFPREGKGSWPKVGLFWRNLGGQH